MLKKLHNPVFFSVLLFKSSLIFLLAVALLGLVLRVYSLITVPLSYTYILHAHSHLAFLGWMFLCNCGLFIRYYYKSKMPLLLAGILITDSVLLVAMGISFMVQGYGSLSIILSAIHVVLSWFCALVFIDQLKIKFNSIFNASKAFLATAHLFLIISGIFPMLLGIINKHYGPGSDAYYNLIYTYLHFQYNGYFIFMVLGFVFNNYYTAEIHTKTMKLSFVLMVIATVLLLANSWLWSSPSIYWNYVSGIGGSVQLVAVFLLIRSVKRQTDEMDTAANYSIYFLFSILILKSVLQLVSSFPVMAELIGANRYFIIFYLHLIFLGALSIPMLSFLNDLTIINRPVAVTINMKFIILGFIGTEMALLYRGILFQLNIQQEYFYPIVIVIFSFILLIALFLYSYRIWKMLI